jgi:hypothetical protein
LSDDEAGTSELNVPSRECFVDAVTGDVLDIDAVVVVNVFDVDAVVVVESILKNVPSSPRSSLLVRGLSV